MVCTTKDLYKSVRKCPGVRITPGIRPKFLAILKSKILTWPKLPDGIEDKATDMTALATYKGNFALEADAKWHVVDLVSLKSSITTETQGEAPSATFLNKAEYIIGGMDADITGFGRMVINDEMIYAQQMPNGRFRILGCEMFAPKSTFAQNSGAGATDSVTSTLSVEATDVSPAPFYEGKLETDEGDISGLDGSVWTEVSQ
ncbi:MAG: hypothetical protein EGS53_11485 [Prevotella sp.]|jgi:hypothetical protein|uniref:hypothetical protein n=1 Tax=Segatella hominis TaxID=2518605 RepID=UPI001D5DFE58|nr:hypothetical protein [Prevotella sp.]